MIYAVIVLVMMVYLAIAIALVLFVGWRTKKDKYVWAAIIFVMLLPTWDVLLGFAVYYPACIFVPRVAIYETAETDSIYFEGLHNYYFMLERRGRNISESELIQIGSISDVCHKGYSFAEALVVEKHTEPPFKRERINPAIYRCIALPKDEERPAFKRTSCSVVSEAKSRYMVKVATLKAGITEINFKKIYDRSTGKLMAEFSRVTRWSYYGLTWIPFFNWMDWGWGSNEPPYNWDYELFEYKVLKPNK